MPVDIPEHADTSTTVDDEVHQQAKLALKESRVSMTGDILPGLPKSKEGEDVGEEETT